MSASLVLFDSSKGPDQCTCKNAAVYRHEENCNLYLYKLDLLRRAAHAREHKERSWRLQYRFRIDYPDHKIARTNYRVNRNLCAYPECSKDEDQQYRPFRYCAVCQVPGYCNLECQTAHWPVHQTRCGRWRYQLLLSNSFPWITYHQGLWCPHTASFRDLSKAINIAFGWQDSQEYAFLIKNLDDDEVSFSKETLRCHLNVQSHRMSLGQDDLMSEGENRLCILDVKYLDLFRDRCRTKKLFHRGSEWLRRNKCHNSIAADLKVLSRVFEDVRFRFRPCIYYYGLGNDPLTVTISILPDIGHTQFIPKFELFSLSGASINRNPRSRNIYLVKSAVDNPRGDPQRYDNNNFPLEILGVLPFRQESINRQLSEHTIRGLQNVHELIWPMDDGNSLAAFVP